MDERQAAQSRDLNDWGSIPFWSWNGDLKPERLIKQIRNMKRQGMSGFIIHARRGLKTEYLSDRWFECVSACVDEAERLDMEAWIYDENGWPSGIAGGKLLEDAQNHVWYLECRRQPFFDERALAVFVWHENDCRRVEQSEKEMSEYYAVYACQNPSYVDLLNPRIVREFLRLTHEQYVRHYGSRFGKRLKGFFTDEPQYFRLGQPWSPIVPEMFRQAYGYDVRDGLLSLFEEVPGAPAFRNDFWKLMNRLLMDNYQKTVYDWCCGHHCAITGHTIEETSLEGQMMCCAGAMSFYEYEHIPGIDCLTRNRDPELAARQCASVAHQLGKRQVLTETFAACGWDITPRELKRLGELQYAAGINRMSQHLYPYSIVGARKRDYPLFFSEHNP